MKYLIFLFTFLFILSGCKKNKKEGKEATSKSIYNKDNLINKNWKWYSITYTSNSVTEYIAVIEPDLKDIVWAFSSDDQLRLVTNLDLDYKNDNTYSINDSQLIITGNALETIFDSATKRLSALPTYIFTIKELNSNKMILDGEIEGEHVILEFHV